MMLGVRPLTTLEPNVFRSQVFTNALPPLSLPSPAATLSSLPPFETIALRLDEQHSLFQQSQCAKLSLSLSPFDTELSRQTTTLVHSGKDARPSAKQASQKQGSSCSWLRQARGRDGRFLPKGVIPCDTRKNDHRKCGWCRTLETTQWRAGPVGSKGTFIQSFLSATVGLFLLTPCSVCHVLQIWGCFATPAVSATGAPSRKDTMISIWKSWR